ncbi:hypothetical protein NYR55_04070 [Sphingomonas sp. BGYR3]|uniref:hypothetical protein n=1 Tax=Sphingomonas sp. BGYR3 TaxID=2975483 RepID=UPI0021A84214|nr:hypothetical protein [Sphingomonas sp. BGYR3]MDG5487799.1 hypothetical protein [Sphingomonas sp. BGYR3]
MAKLLFLHFDLPNSMAIALPRKPGFTPYKIAQFTRLGIEDAGTEWRDAVDGSAKGAIKEACPLRNCDATHSGTDVLP